MKVPKIELTRRGKSGIFWVRYSFNGKRMHYGLGTTAAAEAEDRIERIKYEIKYDKHHPLNQMIFDNLLERFLKAQQVRNVEKSYTRDLTNSKPLLKAFSGRRLDDITHQDLEIYMAKRVDGELNAENARKKAPSKCTVNHEIVMMKHMFNKAVEWGLLAINQLRGVKLFRLPAFNPRYATLEELVKLHRNSHPELWDVIVFLLCTGMRPKELFSLKWSDIDWPQKTITVLHPKNKHPRIIPVNNSAYNLLLRRNQHRAYDYVFPGRDGKVRRTVRTAFKAACRRAGIEGLKFYDLRKTFCTWLVTEGFDIRTVQGLSGHLALESMEPYLAFRMEKKREAVGSIDILLEKVDQNGPNLPADET